MLYNKACARILGGYYHLAARVGLQFGIGTRKKNS